MKLKPYLIRFTIFSKPINFRQYIMIAHIFCLLVGCSIRFFSFLLKPCLLCLCIFLSIKPFLTHFRKQPTTKWQESNKQENIKHRILTLKMCAYVLCSKKIEHKVVCSEFMVCGLQKFSDFYFKIVCYDMFGERSWCQYSYKDSSAKDECPICLQQLVIRSNSDLSAWMYNNN